MEDRKPKVLDAALELFARHGFKRTTMGDIAEAAEMSRPALYLLYDNKEGIFRSTLERHYEEVVDEAWERVGRADKLEEKLEALLRTWVVEPYELALRSPDARELYECAHSLANDVRERLMGLFIGQLEEVLSTSPEIDSVTLEERDLEVGTIAEALAHSSLGIKCSVSSLAELERLLGTLIHMVVGMAGRWKCGPTPDRSCVPVRG